MTSKPLPETEAKTVLVDFDGTLADYSEGWCGEQHLGVPLPGAKDLLKGLFERGFNVVIFSCRTGTFDGSRNDGIRALNRQRILRWLRKYDLRRYVTDVSSVDKPIASFIIDDRAIGFRGNSQSILDQVDQFKPWWKE